MLYVRNLSSSEEHSITCVWNLPRWLPDSEHFIYDLGLGNWQLGNIYDATSQPLDILNVSTDPNIQSSARLTWINAEYFLLLLRSSDACVLNIATLQGIVTEITRTSPDGCPRGIGSSLPK
jgi:hypothetical protein